jgi:hypothetical protein
MTIPRISKRSLMDIIPLTIPFRTREKNVLLPTNGTVQRVFAVVDKLLLKNSGVTLFPLL